MSATKVSCHLCCNALNDGQNDGEERLYSESLNHERTQHLSREVFERMLLDVISDERQDSQGGQLYLPPPDGRRASQRSAMLMAMKRDGPKEKMMNHVYHLAEIL